MIRGPLGVREILKEVHKLNECYILKYIKVEIKTYGYNLRIICTTIKTEVNTLRIFEMLLKHLTICQHTQQLNKDSP